MRVFCSCVGTAHHFTKKHKHNLVYRTLNVNCVNTLRETLFACSAAQGCKFKDCCEVVAPCTYEHVCVRAGKVPYMKGLVQIFLSELADKVLFFGFRQQIQVWLSYFSLSNRNLLDQKSDSSLSVLV